MVKSRGQQIRFKIFGRPPLGHTIKKLSDISHCWSRDMLRFIFLYKGQGLASLQYFVYEIKTNCIKF